MPDRPTPEILARKFAEVLRTEYLTDEEMIETLRDNREEADSGVCHSHDHCDANMAMLDAWTATTGETEIDANNEADAILWSKAWDLAKQAEFWVSEETPEGDDAAVNRAVDAALDEACRIIQEHLGVTTGDHAGMYWSGGDERGKMFALLRTYLDAERMSRDADR